MRRTLSITLFLAALGPATAHADAAEQVADDLDAVLSVFPTLRTAPAERFYGHDATAADCRKAVAKGKKAGLDDDARIYAFKFRELEDEVHYDDDRQPYLELGEIPPLCDEYERLQKMVPAAGLMKETLEQLVVYRDVDPGFLGSDMGKILAEKGQACAAAADQAIAAGAPSDLRTMIGELEVTLVEGKAQICDAMTAFGGKADGDIKAAHAAEFERIAAKYKKAGIKGERLKLFVENDNVDWMTKGCQTLRDLKKLKKAKKLFQWWEAPDGTITIRTYSFKGDKVKSIKNKSYWSPEAAHRGCK